MIANRWTETAAGDLEAIRDYISRNSPTLARAVVSRLFVAVTALAQFPDAGRVVPERGSDTLRELIEPPYRIIYRRRADAVEVLTIFHFARMFSIVIPGEAG